MMMMTACGEAATDPLETLAEACADARDTFAAAPTPADRNSQAAFLEASDEVTQTVAGVVNDVEDQIEDPALADLSWQLSNFPQGSASDDLLGVAHLASAGITRLDRFAQELGVPNCAAATWRPADWRAMADRLKDEQSEADFMAQVDQLCADTFPDPAALADGGPLLEALAVRAEDQSTEDTTAQVLPLLGSINDRPSDAARFIRDFSQRLPQMSPPENVEAEYIALLAAFIELQAVIPRVLPRNPTPEFEQRASAALEDLEAAWADLGITC
jgi:hypothetical protein